MKQFIVYGLLVLMSLLFFTTEKAVGERSRNRGNKIATDRIDANGCYTTSDYLFDNESGEPASNLDHFTSDQKYFFILSGIRPMDKGSCADKVSVIGNICDFGLSRLGIYSVFGLHRIIV